MSPGFGSRHGALCQNHRPEKNGPVKRFFCAKNPSNYSRKCLEIAATAIIIQDTGTNEYS